MLESVHLPAKMNPEISCASLNLRFNPELAALIGFDATADTVD